MEDKLEYVGTSSDVHKKLEVVAESLGVSTMRDEAWPKSARWLWRRIKEVLPLLVAAGIEANRKDAEKSTKITLRKVPRNDCSNSSGDEDRKDKPGSPGIRRGEVLLLIPGVSLIPSLIPAKNRLLVSIMESLETLESKMGTSQKAGRVLRSTAGIVCARSARRYEARTPATHLPPVGSYHVEEVSGRRRKGGVA